MTVNCDQSIGYMLKVLINEAEICYYEFQTKYINSYHED
jgi:hypothetical protein